MTKRILGLGIAAAAAFTFALPAAPAQAHHCWGWVTTPVQCAQDIVNSIVISVEHPCPIEGTQPSCLKN